MNAQPQTITLNVPWNKKAFLELHQLRWELARKSVKRNMFIYGIGLVIFLPWAIFQFILYPYFNLLMPPALLFLVFEGYLVLFYILQKRRFFGHVLRITEHFDKEKMDMSYTATDISLIYRDKEETVEMPWGQLKAHSLYNGYVVLWNTDASLDTALFIGRDPSVSQRNWDAFVRFIAEKLPEKVIRQQGSMKSGNVEILDGGSEF
jgi:hypothetical protein